MVIKIIIILVVICTIVGYFIESAEEEKRKKLQESAGKGDIKAAFDLGVWYLGHDKLPEARHWLERAKRQGYSGAASKLNVCALKERGMKTSYKANSRVDEYIHGAGLGIASSQYLLGTVYWDGTVQIDDTFYIAENVEPNKATAVHWLKKAAEQGQAGAQFELGRCYLYGEGLEQDVRLGLMLLRRVAENDQSQFQGAAQQLIEETNVTKHVQFQETAQQPIEENKMTRHIWI